MSNFSVAQAMGLEPFEPAPVYIPPPPPKIQEGPVQVPPPPPPKIQTAPVQAGIPQKVADLIQDFKDLESMIIQYTGENLQIIPQVLALKNKIVTDGAELAPKDSLEASILLLLVQIYMFQAEKREVIKKIVHLMDEKLFFHFLCFLRYKEIESNKLSWLIGLEPTEIFLTENPKAKYHEAAMKDDLNKLMEIVTQVYDQKFLRRNLQISLILAALHGSSKCFKYLWEEGIDYEPQALIIAATIGGNSEIIQFLENEDEDEDENEHEKYFDETALKWAVIAHRYELANYFSSNYGGNPVAQQDIIQHFNFEFLQKEERNISWAVESGNIPAALLNGLNTEAKKEQSHLFYEEIFNLLSPNIAASTLDFFKFPIHEETAFVATKAIDDQCAFIKWVYQHGVDPTYVNKAGQTFLDMLAIDENYENEALEAFLDILAEKEVPNIQEMLEDSIENIMHKEKNMEKVSILNKAVQKFF